MSLNISTYKEPSLRGKVAIVTGASRGIGRSISFALAEAGADVACVATTEENAQKTARDIQDMGRRSLAIGGRVEDSDAVKSMFKQILGGLGPVDICVNNAGISIPRPVLEMTEADWDSVFGVNAKGVFLCSQAAARQMKASGKGGAVVNIGSISGVNAFPNRLAYCSSKAAIHHMTRVMAIEWASLGIRVNCIAPGYIRTDMIDNLAREGKLDVRSLENRTPMRRLGDGFDVAQATVYLAGEGAKYITGSVLIVDGGWSAYGYV